MGDDDAAWTSSECNEAIEAYHTLLRDNAGLAEESATMLAEAQGPAKVTFGGKPLCRVLRPHFLAPSTYTHIQEVCRVLSRAMFRLAERMPDDPQLIDPMGLTSDELDLITVDPGYEPVSPTTRLDSFMGEDAWYFVEYNAETPAAIAYEDVLSELFQELPIMREFARRYRVTALPARHRLRDTLLDAYRQWGGRSEPVIGIIDWTGVPTATEFELFAEYFQRSGLQAVIAEPRQLSYDGERLRVDGQPIDLVYRRVLTAELLAQPEVAEPLKRAYKDHNVCVVNSFRAKLLHKKMIFALLSDERYAHHFSDEERTVIARHVPWTREVKEGTTTYQGKEIDLIRFVLDNQERMVLRPNDEYGGKGVVVGWESAAREWEGALTEALTEPYVVQERVPVAREAFPMWADGDLVWPELSVDLDPYLFGTDVTGVLTRLSAAALLNVTAGTGSTAPTFLVDREG